jgi:cytoskeleton protein RodZ
MTKVTQLNVRDGAGRDRQFHLREVSNDGDAPLGTIGQELRGARISRNQDLAAVSRALKIRKDHLEAIEDDRFNALPGRTYAVGFVRAYAEYVGLDPVYAVDRFKTEVAGRDESSGTAGFTEPLEDNAGLSRGWVFFALILLGLVAYGVYYLFVSGSSQPSQPVVAAPPRTIENPQPKAAPLQSPSAAIPAPQAPAPNASALVESKPALTASSAPARSNNTSNPPLVLRAKEVTHILVQDESGKIYTNRVLQPGDTYQVPSVSGLFLTAEHGNAVEMDVNGKPAGLAGQTADAAVALPLNAWKLAGQHTNAAPPQ